MNHELWLEDVERLLAGGCMTPGCKHGHPETDIKQALFIHAQCHPKAGLEVLLESGSGVARIRCLECSESIVNIRIASRAKD